MKYIDIIQIAAAVLLMVTILLQSRGASVGGVFGGGGAVYQTKRGLEKKLFIATIILSIIFFGAALANFVL
jgi:protein translocase SecG subunit